MGVITREEVGVRAGKMWIYPPLNPQNTHVLNLKPSRSKIFSRIPSPGSVRQGNGNMYQEPTETSKQPIRTRYLGHVTGYQPIRDRYFLIRLSKVRFKRLDLRFLIPGNWSIARYIY
eukprot:sb/3476520/